MPSLQVPKGISKACGQQNLGAGAWLLKLVETWPYHLCKQCGPVKVKIWEKAEVQCKREPVTGLLKTGQDGP